MAFIVAFKTLRRSSIIYRHEKKYLLANKLGMSAVTIGKYIAECERLGLIVPHHNERKFIRLTEAIKILFPNENFKAFRHVRFFAFEAPSTQYRQVAEIIKFALASAQFKKQEYHIRRKASIDELGTNRYTRNIKTLKSLAKEHGCEMSDLPSICQRTNHIQTGKYHLARIIGCSPSTAVKLLRWWDKIGVINRTVISKKILAPVNPATFDLFKAQGHKYLQLLNSGKGYFNTYGSRIILVL